ncbi:uncharacterized protein LOC142632833 [Castanea sativa]|uniref:uncharacterized protein LOC142632833 n=1 Tax=Castanea sativa TaxID=21020 RepID=UPI003F650ECA
MEKLVFALVTTARKLKPYFQAYTIVVLIEKRLRRAISSPEAVGQMALWVIEMSEFDIRYHPRTTIKGQVLANFVAEFTHEKQGTEGNSQWRIHTDRSANKHAGGVGIVLRSPEGDEVDWMVHLDILITNNETKYEALIARLDLARAAGASSAIVHCDSQVVTSQINGGYECRGKRMKEYLE